MVDSSVPDMLWWPGWQWKTNSKHTVQTGWLFKNPRQPVGLFFLPTADFRKPPLKAALPQRFYQPQICHNPTAKPPSYLQKSRWDQFLPQRAHIKMLVTSESFRIHVYCFPSGVQTTNTMIRLRVHRLICTCAFGGNLHLAGICSCFDAHSKAEFFWGFKIS